VSKGLLCPTEIFCLRPTGRTHRAVNFRGKPQFLEFWGLCTIAGGHLAPQLYAVMFSGEPILYLQRRATYAAPSTSHQIDGQSKKLKSKCKTPCLLPPPPTGGTVTPSSLVIHASVEDYPVF